MGLYNKGLSLGRLERREDAIAAYDALVGRFGDATEAVIREQVAKALQEKRATFELLERDEEAIATLEDGDEDHLDVTDHIGSESAGSTNDSGRPTNQAAPIKPSRLQGHDVLLGIMDQVSLPKEIDQLTKAKRYEEALALCARLLSSFDRKHGSGNPSTLAHAYFAKGSCLIQLRRYEEAVATYDELLKVGRRRRRWPGIDSTYVARALLYKAGCLARRQRYQQAIATYDELMKRFVEHNRACHSHSLE